MAYLCAVTHGLPEETEALKAVLDKSEISLPQPDPNAVLLQPPCPINKSEENWPLLSVSKGFFDGAMGSRKTAALSAEVSDSLAEGKFNNKYKILNIGTSGQTSLICICPVTIMSYIELFIPVHFD